MVILTGVLEECFYKWFLHVSKNNMRARIHTHITEGALMSAVHGAEEDDDHL